MTIPVWVLLGFAAWTLISLMCSVGIYRWRRILGGQVAIADFRADQVEGLDWYKRAMRAHANCVENLPVYGAIVVAALAAGAHGPHLDVPALVLLGGRVAHTIVHIAWKQTNVVSSVRFAFFFIQVICMFWMGSYTALSVLTRG